MPAMLRPNNEATKIAHAVLGKPYESKTKKAKKIQEISQQLDKQETSLAR